MTAVTAPQPNGRTVQDAHLLLLAQINHLLAEAEKVRVLRDRMLDAARAGMRSAPSLPSESEAVAHAG